MHHLKDEDMKNSLLLLLYENTFSVLRERIQLYNIAFIHNFQSVMLQF